MAKIEFATWSHLFARATNDMQKEGLMDKNFKFTEKGESAALSALVLWWVNKEHATWHSQLDNICEQTREQDE